MVKVGDKIGGHDVVARLKSGGMATLYIGRRRGAAGFEKHVALKVVHEHLAEDSSFVEMFVHEALLSARIAHPNVVHVEELLEVEGRHVLVMEYVHGCSLGWLLRELGRRKRRLTADLAVYIAVKVADGLHAAHETRDPGGKRLNVVHRDVSPENILLAYQGNVKLIDFGVAKVRGQAETKHAIKGKFRYMAPEQASAGTVDRRSDVYALGVVLWEMLTMRRRFNEQNDMSLLRAVRHPTAVAPSTVLPELDPALDAVVLKATQPDPSQRYASAHDLRQALVKARPDAIALHESTLASLLDAVMEDRKAQQREELPSGLIGQLGDDEDIDTEVAEEALQTMTISAASIDIIEDFASSAVLISEAQTRAMDPKDLSALERPERSVSTAVVNSPARWVLVALMTGALVVLAGLGVVAALAVSEEPEAAPLEQTTTVLPPAPSSEPVAPVEPAETAEPEPVADPVAEAPEPEPDEADDEHERRRARREERSERRRNERSERTERTMMSTMMRRPITTEFF